MFRFFIRDAAVGIYQVLARLGLHRAPFAERAFLWLYTAYKLHFEAGPISRLEEFVPPGSLAIDVGANVGFFTVPFAKWVGETGEVIAIEPEERNYKRLVSELERKNLTSRVRALRAVAAEKPGDVLLEINPLHPADHKISLDESGIAVAAVTLDNEVLKGRAARPSLIKIDVQGAEMLVLQGAPTILQTIGPALFIELHEAGLNRFGTSVVAVLTHLAAHGYETFQLVNNGPCERIGTEDIHQEIAKRGYVDILFLKPT